MLQHDHRRGEVARQATEHSAQRVQPAGGTTSATTSADNVALHACMSLCTLAVSVGARAIAVVMTGGGEDGATGCDAVHRCGGVVIVEDPATSFVPAMPKATLRRDDPSASLGPDDIPAALVDIVSKMTLAAG